MSAAIQLQTLWCLVNTVIILGWYMLIDIFTEYPVTLDRRQNIDIHCMSDMC